MIEALNQAINARDVTPLRGLVPDADLDLVVAMMALDVGIDGADLAWKVELVRVVARVTL